MTMAIITGNTYPVKDQLRALGGRWVAQVKGWHVPDAREAEARALVNNQGPSGGWGGKCKTCGRGIRYGVFCGKCEYSR
jgi:hypothetical protein